MRKEPLIAIVLGSLIGIAVAFSLWSLSKSNRATTDSAQNQKKPVENTSLVANEFSIVSPTDFTVASEPAVEVTGLANSGSVVVAFGSQTALAKTTDNGTFSINVELEQGINKLPVWSFEKGQSPKKIDLTLVHTTQLGELQDNATSVFGTVTDIAEETLQIRTSSGEISQLAIQDSTTYVKIVDDPEEIEFSDVAIGDYVAALGQTNNNLMTVERILVTTEPEATEPEAIIGSIQTLSSSEFIVTTNELNEQISIDATGGGTTTHSAREGALTSSRLSNSKEGDEIIVIGEFEDDELVADTIILL